MRDRKASLQKRKQYREQLKEYLDDDDDSPERPIQPFKRQRWADRKVNKAQELKNEIRQLKRQLLDISYK